MDTSSSISRHRVKLVICILLVIALGLASRKFPLFPEAFGKYPGDALWGLMLYFIVAFVNKDRPAIQVALRTALIASLVEFSQLIQLSWLNDIRHTVIGHLILGTTFSWHDIWAYLVGIGIGFIFDKIAFE